MQKQPYRGVLRKRCSKYMQQIYRRTPIPKCGFNKAAKQLYRNHTLAWKICCIFSEHLFLKTPLDGCFCIWQVVIIRKKCFNQEISFCSLFFFTDFNTPKFRRTTRNFSGQGRFFGVKAPR